jgi:hypothetical protein
VLGIVLLSFSAGSAQASSPTPDEALADLNVWRASAGVPPVTQMNPEWNYGCQLHNQYMAATGELTHTENPSSPYYTAAGAEAGRSSDLSTGQIPPTGWSEAVYHRAWLLNPRLSVSGYDASSGYACVWVIGGDDTGRATSALSFYPWPSNGMQQVPTTFRGNETPNPRELDPNGGEMGYLLSVDINGPWMTNSYNVRAVVTSASLTSTMGTAEIVPKSMQPATFGLFPIDPLQASTVYTAHATGYVEYNYANTDYPFEISWQFQTTAAPPKSPSPTHSHHHPRLRRPHLRLKARGKRIEIEPDPVLIGHQVRLNLTRWQHYCWLEPGPPNGHLVRYCSERKIGKPKKSQIKLKEHTMLRLPGLGHWQLYHLLARTRPFKMGKQSYAAAHARITFR